MPYTIPSLDEQLARLVALAKALFPTQNLGSRWSYHWRRLRVISGAVTDLHYAIARLFDDVMPDKATGASQVRWAGIVGITPKSGTPARKSNALRVRGTLAAAVAVGDELNHPSTGLRFQVNENEVIPAALFVDVDVIAIDTGSATRLEAGQVLEFTSPPAGIETQAELVLALDEDGFDAEQGGELRNRTLDAFRKPPQGGAQGDYEAWAKELTGISSAFAYPNRAGTGSVDVAALHTGQGSSRVLTSGEVADLLAYLKTKAPVYIAGSGGALRVLTVIVDPRDVEVTVTPNGDAAWAFDWDDVDPPEVLLWTGASRLLQFADDRPSTMKAGDRLVLRGVASVQDGAQHTIESLSGSDSVILEEAPDVDPEPTDVVYAGGPLVDIVRDAIIAHINGEIVYSGDDGPLPASVAGSTVNLKVLAEGIGTANPAGLYGTWLGGLLVSVLSKLATAPRGARKAVVITPAADYEAVDYTIPLDEQIGLVTPGSILVRRGS